ncbi:hypothetical protein JessAGP_032c [Caulobacter phage Jess A]|nr:hypothetical protein JessAGP_032c [Caulobacter phage Jess A]
MAASGCSSISGDKLLTNLQGCERHYNGVISAGIGNNGFSGQIKVDCAPAPQTAAPQPTSVAPTS